MAKSDSPESILKLERGKGFYVTQDNIDLAIQARAARAAIARGQGSAADHALVQERERLIKKAVEE